MVFMWVLDTLLFFLEHTYINWLRDHTFWAQVELEWRLKVFPSTSNLWFLNFTALRYTLLFLYFEIYIVHIINCEWSRSINFPLRIFCIRYKHIFIQQYIDIDMWLNFFFNFSWNNDIILYFFMFIFSGSFYINDTILLKIIHVNYKILKFSIRNNKTSIKLQN